MRFRRRKGGYYITTQKQIDEYGVKVLLSVVESEPVVPEGQAKYCFGVPKWELRSPDTPSPKKFQIFFFIFVFNICLYIIRRYYLC
jgi:hypothetical protein